MRRTTSYYEIIKKYHPEILHVKYHFVRCVGWHLKIKKCVQKWSKIDQKVQNMKCLHQQLNVHSNCEIFAPKSNVHLKYLITTHLNVRLLKFMSLKF